MNTKDIINKTIAISILVVLILVQPVFICSNLVSYASSIIRTNSPNINITAYFLNENQEKEYEKKKYIDEETETLYLEISVKKEGYLKEGKITLENNNFEIVEEITSEYIKKISNNTIELNTINASSNIILELKITKPKSEIITKNLLQQKTRIVLHGNYIESNSIEKKKDSEIEAESTIGIAWISSKNTKAELNAQLLTNTIIKENDEEKRIMQFVINSKITNNSYPIKNTKIMLSVPNEVNEVKVHARSTASTNKNIEFNENNYEYKKSENKLTIIIENPDTNNINWERNSEDIFVITYIYQNTENKNEKINVNSVLTTYDSIEFSQNAVIDIDKQINGTISYSFTNKEKSIYKGKMYVGEKREFSTVTGINIDYKNVVENININLKESTFIIGNTEINANLPYIGTIINKNEFLKIFGNDGYIDILDSENNTIRRIDSNIEADKNGNIEIKYNSSRISLNTSTPIGVGTLNIENIQSIEPINATKEEIDSLTDIKTRVQINGLEAEKTIKLKNPTTKASLKTNINQISTTADEQHLTLEITLLTNDEKRALFKNPEIIITLPKELNITGAEYTALFTNGLKIEERNISKKESGEYQIYLKYSGEQKKYNISEGTKIYLKLKVKTNTLTPTKISEIQMEYSNETTKDTGKEIIETNFKSRNGLMIYNEIKNINKDGDTVITTDKNEKIGELDINSSSKNLELNTVLINNYSEQINNVILTGKIPTGENGDEYIAYLETIKTVIPDLQIYYTNNVNAEIEDQSWGTSLENAFKYKIVIPSIEPMGEVRIQIPIKIQENIKPNQKGYFITNITYSYMGEIKENCSNILLCGEKSLSTIEVIENIENNETQNIVTKNEILEGLNLDIIATTGNRPIMNNDNIYEGQTIRYKINITNNTGKDLNNIKIKVNQKNGYIWNYKVKNVINANYEGGRRDEHFYEISDSNEKDLGIINNLKNGGIYETSYESSTYKLNNTQLDGNLTFGTISLTSEESGINKNIQTIVNNIQKAELKVDLYEGDSAECEWYSQYAIPSILVVENTASETLNNVEFQIAFSKTLNIKDESVSLNKIISTTEAPDRIILGSKGKNSDGEQIATFRITSIEPGRIIEIPIGVATSKISKEKENIQMIVQAETESGKIYVSNDMYRQMYNISKEIALAQQLQDNSGRTIDTNNELLQNGQEIKILANITNKANSEILYSSITYKIDKVFKINSAKLIIDEEEKNLNLNELYEIFLESVKINGNSNAIIEIIGTVNTENTSQNIITNKLEVTDNGSRLITFSSLSCAIENNSSNENNSIEQYENGRKTVIDPENENDSSNIEASEGVENTIEQNQEDGYCKISGMVWNDENKNGIKEEDEEKLPNIEAKVINFYTGDEVRKNFHRWRWKI